MKRHAVSELRRQFSEVLATGLLLAVWVQSTSGQLAITEVMSDAAGSDIPVGAGHGSDFWELTNFGDQPIDLTGYRYTDRLDTPRPLLNQSNDPLAIEPGESVVFVRMREVASEDQFRNWWGPCLPARTKVRMIPSSPGFDRDVDGVRVYDPAGNLVDRVDFGAAREGVTFVYDTNTGVFGTYSVEGTCGACSASVTNDIGSPGTTCGLVPLGILSQPSDLAVCAGTEATLSVKAAGMPPPKFQWYFENAPIRGATASSLIIPNAEPADSGQYYVVITNFLSVTQSVSVTLTVSTDPSPPRIIAPPMGMLCYTGQTAQFAVMACAYPLPSYQWLSNGVPLPGATERILRLTNASLAMSGVEYCVRIVNSLGATTACARLTVTAKPKIRITELMPASNTNCAGHGQWFELTNQDTNAVNLLGCRFSDRLTFTGSVVITNDIIVQPGESVIFAERMSKSEFACWWGADNLPPELRVFRYVGLGFAQIPGDGKEGLFLWNAASEDWRDSIDFRIYAGALMGVSLVFDCVSDPDSLECKFGADSEVARGGAFRAVECGDIGSPGYTTNPPPRFVGIAHDGTKVTVRWRAVEGRSYRLSYRNRLSDPSWQELPPLTATNSVQTAIDDTTGSVTQRFYRVREESQ